MGLDITIVTSAKTDDEGRKLLRLLGMPFRRSTESKTANRRLTHLSHAENLSHPTEQEAPAPC